MIICNDGLLWIAKTTVFFTVSETRGRQRANVGSCRGDDFCKSGKKLSGKIEEIILGEIKAEWRKSCLISTEMRADRETAGSYYLVQIQNVDIRPNTGCECVWKWTRGKIRGKRWSRLALGERYMSARSQGSIMVDQPRTPAQSTTGKSDNTHFSHTHTHLYSHWAEHHNTDGLESIRTPAWRKAVS